MRKRNEASKGKMCAGNAGVHSRVNPERRRDAPRARPS